MASVGEILRSERERQGLSLAIIATETRIKLQYLEFLERDDFEHLPGKFFARSFTNQYADRLGVNTAELQAALHRQVTPPELNLGGNAGKQPANVVAWSDDKFSVEPLPEGTASALSARKLTASLVGLVAVIIACGAIFWLWQRSQLSTTSAGSTVPQPAVTAERTQQQPPVQPSAPSVQAETPPPVSLTAESAIPSPKPDAPPAVTPAGSSEPGAVAPSQVEGKINLEVVAKETVWVRITVDGIVKVQRALQPGESSVAWAQENARILLGNAGGADIRFNGSSIGPVGPRGQIRTVEFTPGRFTVIEPNKKPDSPQPQQPVAGANE